MRDLAGLQLDPPAFERLAMLCVGDSSFPRTWDQWQHLLRHAHIDAEKRQAPGDPLPIDVDHFERWCQHVGIVPCIDALRAFALVSRMKGPDPSGLAGKAS